MHCICIRMSLAEPLHLIVSPLDLIENRRTRSIASHRRYFHSLGCVTCCLGIKSRLRLRMIWGEYSFSICQFYSTRPSFFEKSKNWLINISFSASIYWFILIESEKSNLNELLSIRKKNILGLFLYVPRAKKFAKYVNILRRVSTYECRWSRFVMALQIGPIDDPNRSVIQ